MKKYLLLMTASLSLTVAHGQANVYHPFPDSNAAWTWQWCVSNPPPACGSYVDFLSGDTIVNSIKYHKLLNKTYGQTTLIGGIRNDAISKKTYFICLNPQVSPYCGNYPTEKILYNFNAGIGDTVFNGICGVSWKVTSIDSIKLLDGTYRKRFNANSQYVSGYVIEGIGNSGRLICGTQEGMATLQLLCFQKDGTTFYTTPPSIYNSNQHSCLITDIPEKDPITLKMFFTPNPFSIQTTLQTTVQLKNATLTIDNCFGQRVAQINNINGQTITLSRGNLANGLYFVRLTADNKVYTDKLVITDR